MIGWTPMGNPSDQEQPFFAIVAGKKQPENRLSRLFCGCFAYSPIFARTALQTIWRECHLPGSTPEAEGWRCDYQIATPTKGGGFLDLCLRPPSISQRRQKPIYLENKVGSPLREEQLQRYKDYEAHVLIAITKNWPEVPRPRLREIGVKALRWQDICRALRKTECRRQIDKFICDSFAAYLETTDMAYREDISRKDLEKLRLLFGRLSILRNWGEIVPGSSFGIANNCLELLDDVKHLLKEEEPKLGKLKSWGPGYWHNFHDESRKLIVEHVLGFGLYWEKWNRRHLFCGIKFPTSKHNGSYLYMRHCHGGIHYEKEASIDRVLSRDGNLDALKIASVLRGNVRAWDIA